MFNFILTFLFSFAAFFGPLSLAQGQTDLSRAWVIDTDVGPDDALALLYFLNQPQLKIKAITIEGDGSAHCKPAFANVKGLLQLTHQTEIPVACGRSTPLRGTHQFPPKARISCDSMANTPLMKPQESLPSQSAKSLLIKTLTTTSQPVNILALGPLTTLTEVFEQRPELKAKIHMIYIMGGALKVAGNIREVDASSSNQTAEWNIYFDPYAAEKLFHSGLPLTLVPLDVTNLALIDQRFYKQLKDKHETAAANFSYALLKHNQQMLLDKSWYFWDPMAAVIATDESLAKIEMLPLSVRLEPESLSGATVIDKEKGSLIRVCMGIEVEKFKARFLQGLNEHS